MSKVLYQDSVRLSVEEGKVNEGVVGDYFESDRKVIPLSNGITFWFRCYPAGKDAGGHIAVFLHVSAPIPVKCSFAIDGSLVKSTVHADFEDALFAGFTAFASHATIRAFFVEGLLSVECKVEVQISVPNTILAPRIGEFAEHITKDIEIVVGADSLMFKKSVLVLLSPVFANLLTTDTDEARLNKITISGYSLRTVNTAFNFYNGASLQDPSVETVINVLRFSERYQINAGLLGEHLSGLLTPQTFLPLVQYSQEAGKEQLFAKCCNIFERHMVQIAETDTFATISPALLARVLKKTFNLNSDFEILRFAQVNGFGEALNAFETLLVERLSLPDFIEAAQYAWECTRPVMMAKCGEIFNANMAEITASRDFIELPATVTHAVLTAAFNRL